jgi:hypothetical protein
MPTLFTTVVNGEALLDVEAVPPGVASSGRGFRAVIDTGAQTTSLGRKIWAAPPALSPLTVRRASRDASGAIAKRKQFQCDLYLYDSGGNSHVVCGLTVLGLDINASSDALIGMDVLSLAVVELNGPKGTVRLRF